MSALQTYLTTDQLSERIHYDSRTIRTQLKDAVLLEGVHYIRPFGGRKLLFIWEAIARDIGKFSSAHALGARGLHLETQSQQPSGLQSLPVNDPIDATTEVRHESIGSPIPMANGGIAHG